MPESSVNPQCIRIGRISRTHGLTGAVRVALDHPASRTLQLGSRVYLDAHNFPPREYQVEVVRQLRAGVISVKFIGIDSCEAAEHLRGCIVSVAEAQLPPLAANEFYDYRALGCVVVGSAGENFGMVEEIFSNGANDVLVVRSDRRETLIPVIADVIKQLDFDNRRITIEAVPGLLD